MASLLSRTSLRRLRTFLEITRFHWVKVIADCIGHPVGTSVDGTFPWCPLLRRSSVPEIRGTLPGVITLNPDLLAACCSWKCCPLLLPHPTRIGFCLASSGFVLFRLGGITVFLTSWMSPFFGTALYDVVRSWIGLDPCWSAFSDAVAVSLP